MNSILLKIIIPFVVLVLIVVGALAVFNYLTTSDSLTAAANQSLLAAARQTANSVRNYLSNTSSFLEFEGESRQAIFLNYLNLGPDQRRSSSQERVVLDQLTNLAARRGIAAYALLDRDGKVWLSSDTPVESTDALLPHLGLDLTDPLYLNKVMLTGVPYVSPVIFDPERSKPLIYFVSRIRDELGIPVGMLVTLREASILQEISVLSSGLAGEDSFAQIVDENKLRLGHGADPGSIYTFVVHPDADQLQDLVARRRAPLTLLNQNVPAYPDFAAGLAGLGETPFFITSDISSGASPETNSSPTLNSAAAVSIPEGNWTVVFLQPQTVFLAPVLQQTRNTLLLAAAVALIAIVAAALIGRTITRPILALTQVAERVATGDLDVRADVKSQDELGTLALAFNVMNARQRQTLEGLEQRVEERTAELAEASEQMRYRAAQLQTVSEVARVIASEQEQDRMLPLITQTISERFGFYHVGIFLLDEAGEFAVLRAANSEGGQRMLARNHKLKVGQVGIIGFVTASGQPRLALDVGRDAVYFDNPDLPLTRSEIGLPLKAGGRVIGALDVQSMQSAAFSQEDVTLLSTLADQVAIAIENARLFSETRRALADVQASQRDYLRTEWSRLSASRQHIGYTYRQGEIVPLSPDDVHASMEPADLARSDWDTKPLNPLGATLVVGQQDELILQVPISLRGETIGVINLGDMNPGVGQESARVWTEDEISLARVVAEQVGLALENARLIEETQRHAERERLVSQITTRLRSSNDPQAILQTAAAELRHVLHAQTAHVIVQPVVQPTADEQAVPCPPDDAPPPAQSAGSFPGDE